MTRYFVLDNRLEVAKEATEKKQADWDKLAERINSLVECRHCDETFSHRIHGSSYSYGTVRCGGCNTRH